MFKSNYPNNFGFWISFLVILFCIFHLQVVNNLWPPIGIIIGMLGQFIILPFLGFSFSILFQLTPYEALGVLIISCSPGGSFSNFFTFWMDGELALRYVTKNIMS